MGHRALTAAVLAAALLLNACAPKVATNRPLTPEERSAVDALSAGHPPALRGDYEALVREGRRNETLNWLAIADHALSLTDDGPDIDAAREALDKALNGIETVYADNPQAEKARSLWAAEAEKDFKGEPYERAMAYIDRGILYLADGDYENARASFKGALLQDSFAEQDRFRQDFASAAWLSGWASHCLGARDLAAEAFAEARDYRADLAAPADDADTLVIIEAGAGPIKEAAGPQRTQLAYREAPGPAEAYRAVIDGTPIPMTEAEDLFFQATTRGGREMDKVLKFKAGVQTAAGAVGLGAALVGIGVMESDNRNRQTTGALLVITGALISMAASSMQPQVDTRQWRGVPGHLYLAAGKRTRPRPTVAVTFADGAPALRTPYPTLATASGRCAVAWSRADSVRLEPEATPGPPKR